jgi:hypothetical protein
VILRSDEATAGVVVGARLVVAAIAVPDEIKFQIYYSKFIVKSYFECSKSKNNISVSLFLKICVANISFSQQKSIKVIRKWQLHKNILFPSFDF